MTIALLAAALLAAPSALNAEVTPLTGPAARGEFQDLQGDQLKLVVEGESRTWPLAAVEELRFSTGIVERSGMLVLLTDGSELRPTQVTLARGKVALNFEGDSALEAPLRLLRSIRFKRQNSELERQWSDIAKAARPGDAVVVRRRSPKPAADATKPMSAAAEESLDFVEGRVTAITADTVEFDLDDEQSSLRREKLDGIIFGNRKADPVAKVKARLQDSGGSWWNLAALRAEGDDFVLSLASGLEWRLPEREVATIDFSPGNVLYLDTISADLMEATFDLVSTSLKASTERLFQPRRISPEAGERLRLGQESFGRGLLLQGEPRLVYQIPAGYQRFTAVAGLPAMGSKQAHVTLSIAVDNQPPWTQVLNARERGPYAVDLPIAGARRLTIKLENPDGLDISDQVLLCKARFLK